MKKNLSVDQLVSVFFALFGLAFLTAGILGFIGIIHWHSGRGAHGPIVEHPWGPVIFGAIFAFVGIFRLVNPPR